VANVNVNAGAVTGTTLVFTANVNGTAGNTITSTSTVAGDEAFTAGTLAGGTAGSTVSVGGQTYTFVAALSHTATANEVISSSQATGLTNLTAAVNGAGGTNYSSNTTRNTEVTAAALVAGTSLTFTANVAGAGGNFVSGAASVGSFATLDFAGGVDAGAPPVATGGDTVTIGTQTYLFVTALSSTPTANEVLVGATEAASLTNLANAVNGGSGAGATYGAPTVKNSRCLGAFYANQRSLHRAQQGHYRQRHRHFGHGDVQHVCGYQFDGWHCWIGERFVQHCGRYRSAWQDRRDCQPLAERSRRHHQPGAEPDGG
jgi:hypothetical protein